jgi:hypothetical protein
VIEIGISDHVWIQAPMHYENKKGQGKINDEFRIARSYREENVQYLNYLLGKETWELVFKQNSANNAYNEFIGTFQYYHNVAMPNKWVKIKQKKINGLPLV